jgi:hypothetical protein
VTRGQLDHTKGLRARSMRIALDMSDLDQHDALAVITQCEELIRYLHRPAGANAQLVDMIDGLPGAHSAARRS